MKFFIEIIIFLMNVFKYFDFFLNVQKKTIVNKLYFFPLVNQQMNH